MKICMFVNNPITNDGRVKREARALVEAGHEVTVIGLLDGDYAREEAWEGVRFLRLPVAPRPQMPAFLSRLAKRVQWRARAHKLKSLIAGQRRQPPHADAGDSVPQAPRPEVFQSPRPPRGLLGLMARIRNRVVQRRQFAEWLKAGLDMKADVYHAHDLDTLYVADYCARGCGAKLVYDSHELWVEWQQNKMGTHPRFIREWSVTEARVIRHADLVITVSDGIADELALVYGIKRPLVVRNCAPLRSLVTSTLLREQIGGVPDRPLFLYQGILYAGRGLEELVAAARLVPDVDIVFMGQDWTKGVFCSIAEHAPEKNIHVLPPVPYDDLLAYTSSADAGFVLTNPACRSYALSLGNKIFEYMAAGLPIIASRIDSHIQIAEETGALVLVDGTDPVDIARGIQELISAPARMRAMGERARFWAEKKYNAEAEMAKLLDAYGRLAESRS
jgi:glycosyltransferase involved in cell wall biosynthesis